MRTVTALQMKELDRIAIEERGIPSLQLMEHAARAAADRAAAVLGDGKEKRVAVLCGPGNNGGDGVGVARMLLEQGYSVRAFLVGDRSKMTADTAAMEKKLLECGGKLEEFDPNDLWFATCDLFVDAVIGIGLHSKVQGSAAQAIEVLERWGNGKAIALDIASGIHADTGEDLGNRCRYLETVTFTAAKPGHFVSWGGAVCGKLTVADIGIPGDLVEAMDCPITAVDADLVRSYLPQRNPLGHKGDFGKVHILGGSVGYTGAPVLAAKAALRTGAGLVSLSVPSSIYNITAVKCDEAMPSPLPCGKDGSLSEDALMAALYNMAGKSACLVGPGLGNAPGTEALVCGVVSTVNYPVVLDADGLNIMAAHKDRLKARKACPTILTPHDGEFVRLGGDLSHRDRVKAAVDLARVSGCAIVLKGHGTITALPNGRAFVNTTGNCGMAKGGSGDVLSGMILALIGQGINPARAAIAAVWLHGRAGDLAAAEKGEYGMTPSDIIDYIPYAIREVTE